MTATATHLENASFLRELAEAEHNEWVKAKIAAARTDTRPRLSIEEVEASLTARTESLRSGSQTTRQKRAQNSR